MDYKKKYNTIKSNEKLDSYKAIVSLSNLAIHEGDIKSVFMLNESLNNIESSIKDYSIQKTLEPYKKLLALEYAKLKPKSLKDRLNIIKKCLDFDYDEEIHQIALAWLFYEQGKYREAIILAEYIKENTDSAPPYHILAKCYDKLQMYGLSIKSYRKYLTLNERDANVERELDEVYKKMLSKV